DLGLAADLGLRDVLALAATSGRAAGNARELPPRLLQLLRAAIADLQRHRQDDGDAAVAAMRGHLDELQALRQQAVARAPLIVGEFRSKLLARVRDFVAAQGLQLAAADVVREVALFADRADVTEELQRLGAHLESVCAVLVRGGSIGRKLEF